MKKNILLYSVAALVVVSSSVPAFADDSTTEILRRLEAKIDALSKDNATLRAKMNQMEGTRVASVAPASRTATDASSPGQLPKNVYAASYPVKAAPVMPAPVFSWTGCYLGIHAGGGWQVSSFTTSGAGSGVGVLGGGQVGCNKQWNQFVIGLEGEFWGSSLYDRNAFNDANFNNDAHSHNRWDGAISVRSGLAFDRAFIYGKLGAIWGKFDYDTNSASSFSGTSTESGNAIFPGVLIGVGFEYALTDHWTTKFEYNHIDFGNRLVNFTDVNCSGGICTTTSFSETVKERKEIAKIGLNYKFY